MPYPSVTQTIRDGGMGFANPAVLLPVVLGATSLGAKNVLEVYASVQALADARGEGPGVQSAANILTNGGGPVGIMAPTTSVAGVNDAVRVYNATPGTNSSITRSGGTVGPAITVSGAPTGVYTMRVEIQTGGILGTATFRWWRDGATYEGTAVLTASTVVLGDTGITVAFPAGTYVSAEVYTWTTTVTGGTIVASGTATLDAHVRVDILSSGALGVATFKYSFDGYVGDLSTERTYSETLTVPAGGVFGIPGLGLTLTFSSSFLIGDAYEVDVECAAPNATNLGTAMTALGPATQPWRFVELVLTRANGDSTAHAVMAAALEAQLTLLQNSNRYRSGMCAADQGEGTPAAAVTAFASTVTPRTLIAYGRVKRVSVKSSAGYANPVTHGLDVFAARAARSLPSTDLKRVLDGPAIEVLKLFHDERATPTGLDDAKISTLRTHDLRTGFFIGQARMKSAVGSDFKYWPHRQLMDLACEIALDVGIDIIGRGLRTNPITTDPNIYPGGIDNADAIAIEQGAFARLAAVLLEQKNAEGTRGWVQEVLYRIQRNNNVLQSGVVLVDVGIRPFGYVDFVRNTIGFRPNLANAA